MFFCLGSWDIFYWGCNMTPEGFMWFFFYLTVILDLINLLVAAVHILPMLCTGLPWYLRVTNWLKLLQAAASVLKAVGDRWNVPWTGETILQVSLSFQIFHYEHPCRNSHLSHMLFCVCTYCFSSFIDNWCVNHEGWQTLQGSAFIFVIMFWSLFQKCENVFYWIYLLTESH